MREKEGKREGMRKKERERVREREKKKWSSDMQKVKNPLASFLS